MNKRNKPKIRCGITIGDPSGIGAEIIAKALVRPEVRELADFVVIGDSLTLERARGTAYLLASRRSRGPARQGRRVQGINVIDLKNVRKGDFSFGKVKAEYGKAALEYLNKGIALIKAGKIDCLVTAPVNKKAVNLAGYHFSGQTEYLARHFKVKDAVMMLLNNKMRVALVTRHIPLKDVANSLSIEKIFKTIFNTALGLNSFFAISHPELAVCGLNPHGSDNGIIGDEERRLIIPAIKMAKGRGIIVDGPYPVDTIFSQGINGKYQAIVCMYHDQGLIPLKMSGFNEAVNITLGLPFVRTSPGHGTAFDIAGKNMANPNPLVQAIRVALQCTQNLFNNQVNESQKIPRAKFSD